jgi:ABC-type phosphate transport system substrate-binding protein
MFSAQNIPGSMVYLSSGFIEQNRALINNKGYGIMAYQKAEGSQIMPYAINNVDATYNWFRPLNMILSCDSDDLGKDFIQ